MKQTISLKGNKAIIKEALEYAKNKGLKVKKKTSKKKSNEVIRGIVESLKDVRDGRTSRAFDNPDDFIDYLKKEINA